jgi:hypothetical protein
VVSCPMVDGFGRCVVRAAFSFWFVVRALQMCLHTSEYCVEWAEHEHEQAGVSSSKTALFRLFFYIIVLLPHRHIGSA